MPRRSNRLIENVEFEIRENPRGLIVSDYLRDEMWDLHTRLGSKMANCCVCDDEAHCRKCTCLTICGHMICVACLYKLRKVECPVCRFPHA